MTRHDGRTPDDLRPISIVRNYLDFPAGSALVSFGKTRVVCSASLEEGVPRFLEGRGEGWVTAEYSMLPGSTSERSQREAARGKQSGRIICDQQRKGVLQDGCRIAIADGSPSIVAVRAAVLCAVIGGDVV